MIIYKALIPVCTLNTVIMSSCCQPLLIIIIIKLSFVAHLNKMNLARKRVTEESKAIIKKY